MKKNSIILLILLNASSLHASQFTFPPHATFGIAATSLFGSAWTLYKSSKLKKDSSKKQTALTQLADPQPDEYYTRLSEAQKRKVELQGQQKAASESKTLNETILRGHQGATVDRQNQLKLIGNLDPHSEQLPAIKPHVAKYRDHYSESHICEVEKKPKKTSEICNGIWQPYDGLNTLLLDTIPKIESELADIKTLEEQKQRFDEEGSRKQTEHSQTKRKKSEEIKSLENKSWRYKMAGYSLGFISFMTFGYLGFKARR